MKRGGGAVALAALAAVTITGCPDPAAPKHQVAPSSPSATAAPAKWHRTAWSNEGVRLGDARLVVISGERFRVDASGVVTAPTVASPAPLHGLLLVPTASGPRVVGYSRDAVYRFDDPLGAGTFIAGSSPIEDTGTAPGVIRLYADKTWHSIDLDGKPTSFGPLLATWTEFVDMDRGMTWVPYAGLLVTRDGGKTWSKIPQVEGHSWDVDNHGARDGILRLGDEVVDAKEATVRRAEREREPDIVRWLRKTRTSPLEAVAKGGVPAAPGEAIVVGGGLRMVVDLATGMPKSFRPVRDQGDMFNRRTVWRGATLGADRLYFNDPDVTSEDSVRGSLQLRSRPRFVLHERAGSEDLTLLPPLSPVARVLVSASGGMLVSGACNGAPPSGFNEVCARQPDGSWKTYLAPTGRVVGPSADGGFLLARLADGHLWVERELPAGGRVRWDKAPIKYADDVGYLNEIDENTVHVFVRTAGSTCKGGYCLTSVRLTNGSSPSSTTFGESTLPDSFGSKLAFISEAGLHVSDDVGAHFRTEPHPPLRASTLGLSEMGIDVDGWAYRLGWGPQAPLDIPPDPKPPITLTRSSQRWVMKCDGVADSAPRPAPVRAEPSGAGPAATNDSLYGTGVEAAVDITETKTGSRVTVQWIDGLEVPARLRTATAEVKEKIPELNDFSAVANRDKAVFVFEIAGMSYAARASGKKLEWVQFGTEQRHLAGPKAIAADGAAAWVRFDEVWYWPPSGEPRLIATTEGTPSALSAPRDGALTVFYVGGNDVATRSIDLQGAAVRVDHRGWLPAPFRFGALPTLPACGKTPPAGRVVLESAHDGGIDVAGWSKEDSYDYRPATFAVRFDAQTACLEAAEMLFVAHVRTSFTEGRSEGGTSSRSTELADLSCTISRR